MCKTRRKAQEYWICIPSIFNEVLRFGCLFKAVNPYGALPKGEASKVVPIDKLSVVITLILAFVFLKEKVSAKSVIGCILIAAGTLVMVL